MSKGIRPSRLDQCAGCSKDVQRTKTSAEVIYCLECRRAGKAPSKARHGTDRRYKMGCRCRVCRDSQADAARAYRAQLRREGRKYIRPSRRDIPTVLCEVCSEPLRYRGRGARVHKGECKKALEAMEARRNTRRRVARAKLAKAAAGTPSNPNWPFTMGTCHYCRETFVRRNTPSAYCSSACRRADKPQPVRPSVRRQVFERDDFICQLCFAPTEPDADSLSDWYPTIDHIVPQSLGGSHDSENLRCAHRWCNSVRGNGTHYTEADLRLIA